MKNPLRILTFATTIALGNYAGSQQPQAPSVEIVNVPEETRIVEDNTSPVSTTENAHVTYDQVEFLSDETRIGRRGKNKVEVKCFDRGETRIAEVKFYSRLKNGEWEQKQALEFQKDHIADCDPDIKDFNNDGLRDLTYISDVAARGANVVRTLFIYDRKKDELIHVINSNQYPNLGYNPKLKCIDAWLFHGATTTVFLRLEGNKLKEFASVDTGLQLIVTVIDNTGNKKIVRREDMDEDDIYTRYLTYDPPTPNNDSTN